MVVIQGEMIVAGMAITETKKIDLGRDQGIEIEGGDNMQKQGWHSNTVYLEYARGRILGKTICNVNRSGG